MSMLPVMSIIGAKDMLNELTSLIGSAPGIISIYSGSQPATTLTGIARACCRRSLSSTVRECDQPDE